MSGSTRIVDVNEASVGLVGDALKVTTVSSVLPTGAATAANQTNGTQKVMAMGLYDGATQSQLRVNGSGELVTMDIIHEHIHDSTHWEVASIGTLTTGAGASINWLMKTGAVTPHIIFDTESGPSGGRWYLYEDSTTTADGAGITIYNSNRNSATAPGLTLYLGPTITADGTLITSAVQGAGGGVTKIGGENSTRNEYILKPNAKYVLRFTQVADNTDYNFRLAFYELNT